VGTPPTMGQSPTLEHEVKFEAPPELALPDLRPLVGGTVRLPEQRLVTTYFETSDRRLWREGLTLRHRMTQDDEVGIWTLKVPHTSETPALQRNEFSWAAPADMVPAAVTEALRGVLRHQRLGPLVTLETTRQRLALHGHDDKLLAELDDDHVLVVGGARDGLRFRQVELELIDHGWEGREVIGRLEASGARIDPAPKLAMAVDLSQVSPEDVHQARVATRRLRSNLKTFSLVLDPVWTRHVRGDLEWLGLALGDVRDADVLVGLLNDAPELLLERLADQRSAASRRLAHVLESKRYLDLLDKLHAASERLPLAPYSRDKAEQPARVVLPPLIRHRWRAVRREVRRAGSDPSAAQLHRVRIKAKQLRYAAEVAAPIVGKPAKRTAAAAERVQTVLGEHHDAVASEAWLRSQVDLGCKARDANLSPGDAFAAGSLTADFRRAQCLHRRQWTHAWRRLARPKRRRWLHAER
jgi:CHAD domain-containing protein